MSDVIAVIWSKSVRSNNVSVAMPDCHVANATGGKFKGERKYRA
jgi:hypothetical protein